MVKDNIMREYGTSAVSDVAIDHRVEEHAQFLAALRQIPPSVDIDSVGVVIVALRRRWRREQVLRRNAAEVARDDVAQTDGATVAAAAALVVVAAVVLENALGQFETQQAGRDRRDQQVAVVERRQVHVDSLQMHGDTLGTVLRATAHDHHEIQQALHYG